MASSIIGFLESPLFALGITLFFGVLAVSGKVSQHVAQVLLIAVWIVGSLAIFRSGLREPRLLTASILVLAACCLFVSYWIKPLEPLSPTARTSPPVGSVVAIEEAGALMPLVRQVTIPAMVLVNLGPGSIIPPMGSSTGGDFAFSGQLATLSRNEFEPLFRASTPPPLKETFVLPESDRPKNREAGARFAVELFQYALFRAIDRLQHDSTEFVKGIHRTDRKSVV